ncbi:MAG: hypothetical protein D6698_12555 [Gammaproteobacteria bacterium]|nr:MAG: hypothetical protein D6698_12555 [Gammaproteobacteria bacterium]
MTYRLASGRRFSVSALLGITLALMPPSLGQAKSGSQASVPSRIFKTLNDFAGCNEIPDFQGVRFGIKINRAKHEYPELVIEDIKKLHRDRINAIMLALPWRSLADQRGMLDKSFIQSKLTPVLELCKTYDIPVVIAVHNVFWGGAGNWSVPAGVQRSEGFKSSTSILTDARVRARYIAFLKQLISSTVNIPSVVGYNILNEPVAATRVFLASRKDEFLARWNGVIKITEAIRQYLSKKKSKQRVLLIVGNANGDPNLAIHAWKRAGPFDLKQFWTRTVGLISGQRLDILEASDKWYSSWPKIRTEGYLSFAVQKAYREGHAYRWEGSLDRMATYYDYDAVYDYEGRGGSRVSCLKSVFVWRIGSPDGSAKHLRLFDHRHNDHPTPYYYALRDLASGIDSFESFGPSVLPGSRSETLAFNPSRAKHSISRFWSGSGKISAVEGGYDASMSSMAARIKMNPGEEIMRRVISANWTRNGVTVDDYLVFYARAAKDVSVSLCVDGAHLVCSPMTIKRSKAWKRYGAPLKRFVRANAQLGDIVRVGFRNEGETPLSFVLDDFLIRDRNMLGD